MALRTDTLDQVGLALVGDAIAFAAASRARGTTLKGSLNDARDFVQVEQVVPGSSLAWRVVDTNFDLVGHVTVLPGFIESTSHAIDDLAQALLDENVEEQAELHEYDEDYFRAEEV